MARRGLFIVIDGLDGIGKGVIEEALKKEYQERGGRIFNVIEFSKANGRLPLVEEIIGKDYTAVHTSEPSYSWVGRAISEELIAKNGRSYSFSAKIQAYSLDRLILIQRLIRPLLEAGIDVFGSRCLASTLSYQCLEAMTQQIPVDVIRQDILKHEGNILELLTPIDLIIIPTINDVDALIKRIEARKAGGKDDNCVFENTEFQRNLKPFYEDPWLKELFESHGTTVKYLDAGISVDASKKQAVGIYLNFLVERGLLKPAISS